jgi:hypothetical protein
MRRPMEKNPRCDGSKPRARARVDPKDELSGLKSVARFHMELTKADRELRQLYALPPWL